MQTTMSLSARFLSLLALVSVLSISFSHGFTSEQKANEFEKNYEKLDLKAVADLFMAGGTPTEQLDINTVGYDMHKDYYYFKFEREHFATKKFAKRKIITAGQRPDSVGHTTQASLYPFAVSQKSTSNALYSLFRDTTTDRFDVKEDKNGNEFFGLYDGHNGNRVVNKVRGLLLRKVANAVKDLLPLLDKVTHPMIEFQEEDDVIKAAADYAQMFKNEIGRIITSVFKQVDSEIQIGSLNTAKSGAAGSVVIVTKYNIIVAWMGNVRVLTYDEDLKTKRLTNDHSIHNEQEVADHLAKGYRLCPGVSEPWFESCTLTRSFASTDCKTKRYHEAEPEVKFVPRYFFDEADAMMSTQFVVMETASVATRVTDEQVTRSIVSAVEFVRGIEGVPPTMENSMYHKMVDNVLNDALAVPSLTKEVTDFSILVIGLEKEDNYKSVH